MLIVVKKSILVAPLDWGLGHATRCIPIIRELLNAGYEVLIAADGQTKILLLGEFPYITILSLKGYQINYSKTKKSLFFKLLFQIPKVLAAIKYEHQWLKRTLKEHKIDLVLSDNRYGLYSNNIPSVFVTHQLRIQAPFFAGVLQRINYRYINRFSECWVPDEKTEPGLAGRLSHPFKKPQVPLKYIGSLSRFAAQESTKDEEHLLILLSGPEPQRTILEKKLIKELEDYTAPVFFIRGLPGHDEKIKATPNIKVLNHLPANQLEEAMRRSFMIIGRSGYSSVMDIMKLQKKSILIPTPGQTEQEYLAEHLLSNQLAYCVAQKDFNLKDALQEASSFSYRAYTTDDRALKKAVGELTEYLL